ncbi:DUF1015 domain-containing protein [Daejeonella sp.]|uniref:DUF1015 domain-containing protein n=1 Tax=Daejeonella sp. TaxID=2805397 RepID=UPI0039836116
MPTIKPFYGIRPNPAYAGKVVLDLENLSLQEAKIIRQENPYSFVNMLVPKVENLFLRGSKNELAFKQINENFEEFIEEGVLVQETKPSLYVYQVSREGNTQTGIWTVTSVDDYLNNRIKKHEFTRPEREAVLIDYLQQTGIDANPVLIAYHTVPQIDHLIDEVCLSQPELSFNKAGAIHKLWKTDESSLLSAIVSEFAKLDSTYIADGHHRAAAASLLALRQRELNPNHTRAEEFNFFTSVFMASDQLKIYPFHRLVKDLNGRSKPEFLAELSRHFSIEPTDATVLPGELHEFGMYLDGLWYKLKACSKTYQDGNPLSELDVSILQEMVFNDILDIPDPRTDPRIGSSGGILPLEDLILQVDNGSYAVAFTLFPTSINQLFRVADEGRVMPPKSTWFEPKFQAGLLTHKIN